MSKNAVELSYKTILVKMQQLINFKWAIHKKLTQQQYLQCLSNANLFTHFSYGYLIKIGLHQGN